MTMTEDQVRYSIDMLNEVLPQLFQYEEESRVLLETIGRQRLRQTPWSNPRGFWVSEVRALSLGAVVNGIERLLLAASAEYPGNPSLLELARLLDAQDGPAAASQAASQAARPAHSPRAAAAEDKPDLPDATIVEPPEPPGQFHTFVLSGSDEYDRFLELVRAQVDSGAEQCYVTSMQSAVLTRDPGPRGAEIEERLFAEVSGWEPGSDISVEHQTTSTRPVLLSRVIAHGTDNRSFELRNVPSTTLVSDIARAVLQEGYTDNSRRRVRTTVDRIRPDGEAERLDPNDTLADAGVRDGDELRLATEATAGAAVSTAMWRESVQRAHAQIRRFAAQDSGFTILETDNDSLPTYYLVEFTARGFAPPPDLDAVPLAPRLQSKHQVQILLPADFPIRPPMAIFVTGIFHPNVLAKRQGRTPAGAACLGALTDSYRPDLDFGELCRMLVNMAAYQEYETRLPGQDEGEGEGYLNFRAASWARSQEGQQRILDRGGKPLNEIPTERLVTLEVKPMDADDDWGAYEDEA